MAGAAEPVITDVWSRTAPKYRTRAVLLLIANMVLFGAMCCFMYWLRTGWNFPLTDDHYGHTFWTTLNFAGDRQVTLHNLFYEPINLKLVPMHAVVIGLMIASLVSIPILVGILYRLPAAVPFCIMVAFLAVMPWLGATLLLSCTIAAYGRLKLKFRFVAALLGLVPIGVYFFTASRGYVAPADVLTSPIERGLLIAPLLLCGLASCALVAVVLTIARTVNYRPGAIAPLLAIMFLTPWFVFTTKVGRDELYYRFLELHYGPKSREYFANADAGYAIRRVAFRWWSEHPEPRPTVNVLEEKVKQYFEQQLEPIDAAPTAEMVEKQTLQELGEFAREQYRVACECDKFLRDFPGSRYVPSVLYLKGRALDMRVDIGAFREHGVLRFYDDFPNAASRPTWTALLEGVRDSPLTDVACYRLAQLDARAARIDVAIRRLLQIVTQGTTGSAGDAPAAPSTLETLLAKKPPEASLQEEFIDVQLDAARLLTLLRHNRDHPSGDAALVTYLRCDPRHRRYAQNLQELRQRCGHARIIDNIELQLVLQQPSPKQRIPGLEALRSQYPDGDTMPQIIYELAVAYLEEGRSAEAGALLEELTARFPESTFAVEARRRIPLGSVRSPAQSGV